MLSAFPEVNSTRAVIVWMCGVPSSSRCSTAQVAYWSGERPANAVSSHSFITVYISSGAGLSPGAQAITPLV